VGPPQNVAIAPDESIVLVSANMKPDPADPKKLVPDNRLTVLDLKGNPPAVIATLETGLGPAGISINRAGTLALVANRNDGTVSIFTISANSDRPRKDRSWQIRNPARAASHFRSGRGPSPRTGKRISDARDEGPQSASGRSSFPAATANGPLHPPQTAENRGCSAETGNSGLAQTRTGNQTVIDPSRQVPNPAPPGPHLPAIGDIGTIVAMDTTAITVAAT